MSYRTPEAWRATAHFEVMSDSDSEESTAHAGTVGTQRATEREKLGEGKDEEGRKDDGAVRKRTARLQTERRAASAAPAWRARRIAQAQKREMRQIGHQEKEKEEQTGLSSGDKLRKARLVTAIGTTGSNADEVQRRNRGRYVFDPHSAASTREERDSVLAEKGPSKGQRKQKTEKQTKDAPWPRRGAGERVELKNGKGRSAPSHTWMERRKYRSIGGGGDDERRKASEEGTPNIESIRWEESNSMEAYRQGSTGNNDGVAGARTREGGVDVDCRTTAQAHLDQRAHRSPDPLRPPLPPPSPHRPFEFGFDFDLELAGALVLLDQAGLPRLGVSFAAAEFRGLRCRAIGG
ncbi:hypothetical protein K438DRAFT_1760977 [Mycena galopus ATCC 62051]|nr:hypothetical protein K438DRAFT_1760977 [Mycena galopus ATCC 62051]